MSFYTNYLGKSKQLRRAPRTIYFDTINTKYPTTKAYAIMSRSVKSTQKSNMIFKQLQTPLARFYGLKPTHSRLYLDIFSLF